MPTYEYACKACEHSFEIVQSFSEDSLTTCPECEQDALRKVYNAAGIIFKGDGWHVKDYAATSSATSSSTSNGSSGGDEDSTATPAKKAKKAKKASDGSGSAARPAAS